MVTSFLHTGNFVLLPLCTDTCTQWEYLCISKRSQILERTGSDDDKKHKVLTDITKDSFEGAMLV